MIFKESVFRFDSQEKGLKIIYSDGYYELMGYHGFNGFKIVEVGAEIKSSLMDIFRKLENAERRILRKHGIDVIGKLNWKDFNHR